MSQLLGHFNRIMHKFMKLFKSLEESEVAASLPTASHAAQDTMFPVSESLSDELVRVGNRYCG